MTTQGPERLGAAHELGEQLTVVGRRLQVGEPAPDFILETLDGASGAIQRRRLADFKGQVALLNLVNSLDTPVCDVETRHWDALRAELPAAVHILTISMDLPFAQARWCGAAGVGHQALSAHKSEDFGRDYGALIKEWRLLQRAVFVVDRSGTLRHAEYVADQMSEPDYDSAIKSARAAAR